MSKTQAMTIAVEFEIRAENTSTAEWLATWGIRALDAFEHEPKTTAYEAAICTDDANRVLVFERYEGGDTALAEHMGRPAHKALEKKMGAARMTKRRPWIAVGYEVDEFGWQVSKSAGNGVKDAGLSVAMTAIRCPDLTRAIGFCRSHAETGLAGNTGMLLYGLNVVSADDLKDFDLRQGDLILSRVYIDHDAQTRDESSGVWKIARDKLGQAGGEVLFSRTYVTSGSGFVWKGRSQRG